MDGTGSRSDKDKLNFEWLLDGAKKRDEKFLKQMSRSQASTLYRNAKTYEAQYVLNKIEIPEAEDEEGADVKELERMVIELE